MEFYVPPRKKRTSYTAAEKAFLCWFETYLAWNERLFQSKIIFKLDIIPEWRCLRMRFLSLAIFGTIWTHQSLCCAKCFVTFNVKRIEIRWWFNSAKVWRNLCVAISVYISKQFRMLIAISINAAKAVCMAILFCVPRQKLQKRFCRKCSNLSRNTLREKWNLGVPFFVEVSKLNTFIFPS